MHVLLGAVKSLRTDFVPLLKAVKMIYIKRFQSMVN